MNLRYDSIYISPHLDDAALSCGGQIFEQTAVNQTVLIVTITAGDPVAASISEYAQSLHSRWELVLNATAARREEDVAACRILGADYLHWQVPDCIYRFDALTGASYYLSDDDIFGNVHPGEMALVEQLVAQLRQLPVAERIYAPLTMGNHVDHQLARTAVEHVFGNSVIYYEDYPYAQEPGALDSVLPANQRGWEAEVVALSETAVRAKFDAIAAFKSQLSTFFNDRADLEQQVGAYIAQVGGERIWHKQSLL